MYFLRVEALFSAALYIPNSTEKFSNMHGHDYRVWVTLKSETLNSKGMVWDYDEVQREINTICSSLDHVLLNDRQDFTEINPTCENLAKYIYTKLKEQIPQLPVSIVEVEESKGVTGGFTPEINV